MAILGGGGQSVDDPVYVDTLESLKEVLADEVNLYKYIAFPEVYDGPKVIDLRSAGWNPINITAPYISGSNRNDVYIHFNNWTILGLSMMDSISANITFFNNKIRTYIYDLIIKNAYVLAATSEAAMFECNDNLNLSPIINFYRCKFSMCIDAQNSDVTAFHGFANAGSSTSRHMNFYQCSFNTNYVINRADRRSRLYYQNYSAGSFVNCIFNVIASHHREDSGYANYLIGVFNRMQFCKIIGSIEHIRGNEIDILELSNSGSVYNVIDMNIINHVNGTVYLRIRFGSGTNIIDSSKVYNAPEVSDTAEISKEYSNLTECTTAQMQDKDYLNSIEFICGDAPT